MKRLHAFIIYFWILCTVIQARQYNVLKYGASGNGSIIDSYAINTAIEAASKSKDGIVYFPKGIYSCYSIHLQSNVTLRFAEGAVIKAAKPNGTAGFDDAEPFIGKTYQDFGHSHWKNSLIWGIGLHNVRIEGKGIIDGSSVLELGHRKKSKGADKALAMKECSNVTIKDITMLACGHFAMLLTGVDSLTVDGVTIDSNRDGMDIDCCEHVAIRNCDVNTFGDDAIVLKCSYALGRMKPTSDVMIDNCHVSGYDVGSLYDGTKKTLKKLATDLDGPTGRIKLGTESNSAFRDITIQNCTLTHCRGLAFETVDGAVLENVNVRDITMHDICNSPIYMTIGTRMRAPEGTPKPIFRNVTLTNITATDCDSRYAILLSGQPGNRIDNITLRNINVEYREGVSLDDFYTQKGRNRFFQRYDPYYPEPSAHGIQPAWGISMHHIGKITMDNMNLTMRGHDNRRKIFARDVTGTDTAFCLYQVSTLRSLLDGNYDGTVCVGTLKMFGNTGVGTFDKINGEMVVLNDTIYQCLYDGSVRIANDTVLVPFADVAELPAEAMTMITPETNNVMLPQWFQTKIDTSNIYIATMTGLFNHIKVRSELSQTVPYKPLADVMKIDQRFFEYSDIKGTIVALYTPRRMKENTGEGWHFHFISSNRDKGGHVIDFDSKELSCTLTSLRKVDILQR